MSKSTSTPDGGLRAGLEALVQASFNRPIPGYVSAHHLRDLLAALPEPVPTVEGEAWAERLAKAWDEGVRTALDRAVRQDDGITLRLDEPNPYLTPDADDTGAGEREEPGLDCPDGCPTCDPATPAADATETLAVVVERIKARARAEGFREGIHTARADMLSGAFVGGPTYEALRDSHTGQRIATEARAEGAAEAGERIARAIEATRITCPDHSIPDCSPLLNGCSTVIRLRARLAEDARIARGRS